MNGFRLLQGGAEADGYSPSFSTDGLKIIFTSTNANLSAGDTNGLPDIFVKTLSTGTVERVSSSFFGVIGNSDSYWGKISPDGSKVAFLSAATNLVPNDTNGFGVYDVFVKTLSTGEIQTVSTAAPSGTEVDADNQSPSFSPDGTKILFSSSATNLVAGDTNGTTDVFVKTISTGAIERISVSSLGVEANNSSDQPAFSPDGLKVSFYSTASNLIAGDTNGMNDVFVKTLSTGAIELVSTTSAAVQGNSDSFGPAFSPDGLKVAFYSTATNLVVGDTNGAYDIFVKTLSSGAIERVSTTSAAVQGNSDSYGPVFSPDGLKIAFHSTASNLVAGDTNGMNDVFVKTLSTGAIERVSTSSASVQGDDHCYLPVFSPDGLKVAFYSKASNLVAGDTNGANDVFIKTLSTGAIERVSTTSAGVQGDSDSYGSAFSPDGLYVAFTSTASNLVAGDTNGVSDIFVKSLSTGAIVKVSVSVAGLEGNGISDTPVFSPDGLKIAFQSYASTLDTTGQTTTNIYNIFLATLLFQ